jgi:serine/threonine protein phosphatase PrpC
MSMSDERAVEFGQFSQAGQMQPQTELAGYYEPAQIADLTRQGRLLVVADGGGGAAAGETAGRYAVQKILHDFYHSREPDLEKRLLEVIRQTNTAIFERNRRFSDRRPIATTVLAALIHQNKLLVASVGDGRAYVVWDQDIEHLTGDNSSSPQRQAREAEAVALDAPPEENDKPAESSAEEQKAASSAPAEGDALAKTSAEEAKSRLLAEKEPPPTLSSTTSPPAQPSDPPTFQLSNPPLSCSLGLAEQVKIDIFSRRLFAGDMVVLCGGGLTGYVTEKEIAETVTQNSPDLASRRLIDMAAKRGCRDTLAVSMARVLAKPLTQAAPARQALPLAPDWDTLTKSSTRPLPAITARPLLPGQTPPPRRRWPIYVAVVIALLLFSLIGFWAGGYWLAPRSAPVESASSSGNATLDSSKEPTLTQEAVAGAASGQTSPVATAQSASAAQTPVLTPTGTLVAENTSPLPTPTEAISAQAGDVITPTPVRPQPTPLPTIALPASCENRGRFAGDVTVEDGAEFAPGEPFEKVWSVSNYGTCPWGGGYMVRFTEGDQMGAPEQVPLIEAVEPETTGLITISMVAPDLPGTYRGSWQMIGLDGEPFGPDLYLEIKVVPGILKVDEANVTTLYDFVAEAAQAQWSAGDVTYNVVEAPIDRNLVIPDPQGIVVVGPAELRGDTTSPGNVLMTHPHLELGLIEGTYQVDTPLQPTDAIIGSLGLPKAAAINDDGVTFELSFRPSNGPDQLLFSKSVKYEDTPVSVRQALTTLQPGQTGAFTLRVKGGNSLSYDWATWIELRLVRP